jgi:hypothetical protein
VGGTDRRPGRAWFLRSGYCGRGWLHPHVHCVVPAGGFSIDHKRWIRPKYTFFLPVDALSAVFRAKFAEGLRNAYRDGKLHFPGSLSELRKPKRFAAFVDALFKQKWVVYAKPAFGRPSQVLKYLGRYTHRVAISNHRLLAFDGERVTFRWKDYAHGNKQRKMTLTAGVSTPLCGPHSSARFCPHPALRIPH